MFIMTWFKLTLHCSTSVVSDNLLTDGIYIINALFNVLGL